jgi:hypothetical protein
VEYEKIKESFWIRLSTYIKANDFLVALIVVAAVILVGLSFGYENNKLIPQSNSTIAHYTLEPGNHLSFMAQWDGPNYLAIAKSGYKTVAQTNFFPLYPLTIRLFETVFRSPLNSGLFVSWASLVGAIYFYLKIIKRQYKIKDNLEAVRASLFFLLFPTGVFLFAVYTEGLLAFLALAALYLALQKKWLPAAFLVMLATATHITGIFVLVLIALVLLEEKVKLSRVIAGVVIGSLGLISFMIYTKVRFQNALAFVSSQKTHGWLNYGHSGAINHLLTLNTVFLLLLAVTVVYWWKRRKSYSIYALLFIGILFLGGYGGFSRYALMAFPVPFMMYDHFKDKKFGYVVAIALSAIFWAYFLLQYAGGYTGG